MNCIRNALAPTGLDCRWPSACECPTTFSISDTILFIIALEADVAAATDLRTRTWKGRHRSARVGGQVVLACTTFSSFDLVPRCSSSAQDSTKVAHQKRCEELAPVTLAWIGEPSWRSTAIFSSCLPKLISARSTPTFRRDT